MLVGAPKEIKKAERRVGLTPTSVRELVAHGHEVVIRSADGSRSVPVRELHIVCWPWLRPRRQKHKK